MTMQLFHYTKKEHFAEGQILRIVNGEPIICLRAGNAYGMNDPSEYEYGKSICLNEYQKYLKLKGLSRTIKDEQLLPNDRFFILSFSQCNPHDEKDYSCLPMWYMYGGAGEGISIELEVDDNYKGRTKNKYLLPCLYKEEQQRQFLQKILGSPDIVAVNSMLSAPYYFKHGSYSYEKEFRIVYINDNHYAIHIEETRSYVEVFFPIKCLKSITIGPATNQDEVYETINKLLGKHNIENVRIFKSTIPYRNIHINKICEEYKICQAFNLIKKKIKSISHG